MHLLEGDLIRTTNQRGGGPIPIDSLDQLGFARKEGTTSQTLTYTQLAGIEILECGRGQGQTKECTGAQSALLVEPEHTSLD
jgi:hypothetical protein